MTHPIEYSSATGSRWRPDRPWPAITAWPPRRWSSHSSRGVATPAGSVASALAAVPLDARLHSGSPAVPAFCIRSIGGIRLPAA